MPADACSRRNYVLRPNDALKHVGCKGCGRALKFYSVLRGFSMVADCNACGITTMLVPASVEIWDHQHKETGECSAPSI